MTDFIWEEMGDFDLKNFADVTEGWFNWLKAQAANAFNKDKAHPVASIVFATQPKPMKYWAALAEHTTAQNKREYTEFLKRKVSRLRPLGVANMHEIWVTPEPVTDTHEWAADSPDDWSTLPDVQEMLEVILETRGKPFVARAKILRDKQGNPTLGPWQDLDIEGLGGQFAGYWVIDFEKKKKKSFMNEWYSRYKEVQRLKAELPPSPTLGESLAAQIHEKFGKPDIVTLDEIKNAADDVIKDVGDVLFGGDVTTERDLLAAKELLQEEPEALEAVVVEDKETLDKLLHMPVTPVREP